MKGTEFEKFAVHKLGVSSTAIHKIKSAGISPFVIEERTLNITQLDVFSRLLMDRIIFVGVPIDDDVANIVQAQLLFLSSVDSKADITMYLNTPGGSVSAGLGIYDTMQLVSPKVATICTGMAASMGAVLLCAGEKGMRSALPHSKVMIHQPIGGAQGQVSDILIEAKEIEKCRTELYTIISENTNQSVEKIFSDADRNYWMSSQEALEYGMIDKILQGSKTRK